MKVVLLAAGKSNRLKPIADKNLLNFAGIPLIVRQLATLSKAGFDDFIVVGGKHNLESLKELMNNLPIKVQVVEQEDLDDGMAGAVTSVERLVKSGPMLIVSGNDVVERKAFDIVMEAHRANENALIVARKVSKYFPGGYLKVDEDDVIKEIIEKPGAGNEPSDLINLVVHYFGESADLFKILDNVSSENDDRYEVALDTLIKKGSKIKAIAYDEFWQAVKYPWHVLDLMEYYLNLLTEKDANYLDNDRVQIADSAIIKGNVVLEDGVKVMDNAVIIGPAYIGANSVIATGALVRNSQIGANCVVGFSTEVARSYLGDTVWTHSNYIGDSVIGDNCSFGAGTVTGNLRLDEGNINMAIKSEQIDSERNKFGLITGANVRCGINTSFMPGVKIGNNCMIGAGIVVSKDTDDNKFVYAKTELIVKDNKATLDAEKRQVMQNKLRS